MGTRSEEQEKAEMEYLQYLGYRLSLGYLNGQTGLSFPTLQKKFKEEDTSSYWMFVADVVRSTNPNLRVNPLNGNGLKENQEKISKILSVIRGWEHEPLDN